MSLYVPKIKKKCAFFSKMKGPALWWSIGIAAFILVVAILGFTGVLKNAYHAIAGQPNAGQTASDLQDSASSTPEQLPVVVPVEKDKPTSIKGVFLSAGQDYSATDAATAQKEIESAISTLKEQDFNALFVPVLHNGQAIHTSTAINSLYTQDILSFITQKATAAGFLVYPVVDLTNAQGKNRLFITEEYATLTTYITELVANYKIGGLFFTGYALPEGPLVSTTENPTVLAAHQAMGSTLYTQTLLSGAMQRLSADIVALEPSLYTGLICSPVWANKSQHENGMDLTAEYTELVNGFADTYGWLKNGWFDAAVITAHTATASKEMPFGTVTDWWVNALAQEADVIFSLANSYIGSGRSDWSNPDQIVKQLMYLEKYEGLLGFTLDSYAQLQKDTTGSTNAIYKYVSGNLSEDYVLKNLSVTTPSKTSYTTYSSTANLIGASDPEFPITLNGKPLERTELGYFSLDLNLKLGKNTYTLTHKGETKTYTITYKKRVIESISPTDSVTLDGGSTLIATVVALADSTVTAKLNGVSVKLQEEKIYDNAGLISEYSRYRGALEMPSFTDENKNIGKISFTVNSPYGSETRSGGSVTIRKTEIVNPDILPSGGKYVDPHGEYIAEVVKFQAETFKGGSSKDDWSRPTCNYLPLGTIDYCSADSIVDPDSKNTYRLLRSDQRVYVTSGGVPNVSVYRGYLPDVNHISLANISESAQHINYAFAVDWKAPFTFTLSPQSYPYLKEGKTQDFTINSATFQYVDITFKYAATALGDFEIGDDHPLFTKAEWIQNGGDYTLRLTLKKAGAFYGWSAEYNDEDQLVFSFLKPARLTQAQNDYGVSLDGIKILIDAGHGGTDSGALGSNKNYTEAVLNLKLAEALKSELESLGATVYMTRTSDIYVSADDRVLKLKNVAPDLAISIHRDSSTSTRSRGFCSYYFNPFTKNASTAIYNATMDAGLYTSSTYTKNMFHYFFLSRTTDCPVVLTENGFVTNSTEYNNMIKDEHTQKCAKALTKGIVDYFKSIQ